MALNSLSGGGGYTSWKSRTHNETALDMPTRILRMSMKIETAGNFWGGGEKKIITTELTARDNSSKQRTLHRKCSGGMAGKWGRLEIKECDSNMIR